MKFVIDSNILITFFKKESVFRKLSLKQDLILFSPEYSLEEISKYSEDIIKRAKITKKEFVELKNDLKIRVNFVQLKSYSGVVGKSKKLSKFYAKEEIEEFLQDLDFVALALKLEHPIWSNDKLLKKQQKIPVFNTREIISLIDEALSNTKHLKPKNSQK
ncbi:MAG: PIN domain-containing protein [Candidatus Woesearchaeota archaeon]